MSKENSETLEKRTGKEIAKRYALFVLSLLVMAIGVAVTKKGDMGVSPISSTANVMSMKFTALSLGNWLIIWNCVLIVGQIAVLRRKFQLIQMLQLPLSFLFGYFTDFAMWLVSPIHVEAYPLRLAMVLLGTVILGAGVTMSVIANVIMNSGEAFVKAISDTWHKEFGNVKLVFDICCVVLAVVLSLILFNFTIVGAREGTVIAALCTGWVVKFFKPRMDGPLERILTR